MIITDLYSSKNACPVCGQTPCNCTSITEGKQWPDTSNSLAKRSAVATSLKGAPEKAGRTSGMTVATRVDPTITPTSVKRIGSDKPVPSFLQKGVAEGVADALKGAWDKVSQFDNPTPKYNGDTPRREALRKKLELQKKQQKQQSATEVDENEKNPFEKGSLGDALWRELSKTKKASPAQQQRNRERFAKRDAEKAKQQGQLDEVNPHNYDSDEDYYAALKAPVKQRSSVPPTPGVNPDDEDYFREIWRKNKLAKQKAEQDKDQGVDEGWKDKLAAAGLAGAMAMGAGGAHARVSGDYVDNPDINRLTGQPNVTQQDVQVRPTITQPAVQVKPTSSGFSKEYLEKVVNGTHPRPLISKERAQELLNSMQEDTNEGEQQKGADYRDPKEADYGDDYQAMVKRLKKLAGAGPLKTVHDPNKRVYRNMPTAVQPKK